MMMFWFRVYGLGLACNKLPEMHGWLIENIGECKVSQFQT
jgi:hypothetical protein